MVAVANGRIDCTVVVGGTLSNNKGINKKGGGLSAPALTDKDKDDIRFAAEIDADYLAVSLSCAMAMMCGWRENYFMLPVDAWNHCQD
ncbi:pyruvate kinase [Chromatium okenii]|uniref:pyruvate kinase n=1 Tax=Chromatium okenii TaxID=61644 RepID=UPI002412FA28|nr:pyruvate kinase [Chromatium okenii]